MSKYEAKVYGVCPNTLCHEQPVMPAGLSDHPKVHTAVVFCPSCREVYWPLNRILAGIDGAYFGTTFTNLFFMQFPNAVSGTTQGRCTHDQFPPAAQTSSEYILCPNRIRLQS